MSKLPLLLTSGLPDLPCRTANSTGDIQVQFCTTNLGATALRPGHKKLKHCFLKIQDQYVQSSTSLAFGPAGLTSEPNQHVASASCAKQSLELSYADWQKLKAHLQQQAAQGYLWAKNDCCSIIANSLSEALNITSPDNIQQAVTGIQQHPIRIKPC